MTVPLSRRSPAPTASGPTPAPSPSPTEGTAVRGAGLLTLSAVLVGVSNYGLSLVLVRLLPPAEFTVYSSVSSVLLSVGTLAGATVPWVLAREVAITAPGSVRRRLALRSCLLLALGLSLLCAAAACGAVASYAGPGPLAGLSAACVTVWLNSVGAGHLQGSRRFVGLALLRVAEMVVRIAVTMGAVLAGWGSGGAIGAFAVGAAVTSAAGLTAVARQETTGQRREGTESRHEERQQQREEERKQQRKGKRKEKGEKKEQASQDDQSPYDDRLWRRALPIGGIQVLTCLLFTLDVLVAAAVRGGSAELAPYQALLVLARIPLFLSTALATVVFPRLAATNMSAKNRHIVTGFREAVRVHWISGVVVTATVATCPGPLLALVLPRHYASSAGLLPPLALAGFASATTVLMTTVFQAWGPARTVTVTLAAAGLAGGALYAALAANLQALAWASAGVTGTVAVTTTSLARRRLVGLGPLSGALAPLTAGAAITTVLLALRTHPALWAAAALTTVSCAACAARPRRRRPGPYRVLHLGFEDPQQPGAGGGALRTHEVNRRLAARGVEITVVCAPWPGCSATVRDGVRYLPLPAHLGPLVHRRFVPQLAYYAAVVTTLGRLTHRYDPDLVVEEFGVPFSSVCIPYLTRRPVVGVVQALAAEAKAREYGLPFDAVERRGIASHSSLIAVSDGLGAELRHRNTIATVTVIPNGLDPAAFTRRTAARGDHLLFLGRLEMASKGLDLLLHAYAKAAPAVPGDLHIAGDGPHAQRARTLADELGIAARVHWLGRIEGADRFDLLASSRLLCMPSRYETFGMVAAESLATGTPVLAFDIPHLRDLVTDDVGVRVPPADVDAYATALTALANDPSRCTSLGANGPARVRHLDWDKTATAQLKAYRTASALPHATDDEPTNRHRDRA
ncbi:glycosyltransferase [Streptomyces sp. cg2]|uniref:glycosyltransferase n=1 Tax=Streptomyces sp. cg2 TaxID=3238799 RepID=UPI0034E27428